MDGVHDLGGMDGFGAVEVEANEPVFHHAWERRVFGLTAAMSTRRLGNFRHAIERMDPVHYLSSSYYEHWLTALATLLVEAGVVTRAELEAKAGGGVPLGRPARANVAPAVPSGPAPRYAIGSTVRVRTMHPFGHTRCPRYVRGKPGVIVRVDGRFRLPDVEAHSDAPCDQYSYNLRFAARDLWGEAAGSAEAVHVDLWESYLETP
jgi:nitrile hydratase subunit beta